MFKLRLNLTNASALFRRTIVTQEPEILFESVNNAGIITLNRPKALNALNFAMATKLFQKLRRWEKTMTCVIIKGAGDKAFCAGGDAKAVILDKIRGKLFYQTEYNVNLLISKYRTPYIAIMNGITMGGGLGLAMYGSYRVATEKTVVAMPETKIGMIPDVGASYFMPTMQGNLGLYLGLTGNRLKGRDVVKSGIATHFVPSCRLQELCRQLSRCFNESEIQELLSKSNEPSEKYSLLENIKDIDYCFAGETVEAIIKRLLTVNNEWSNKTLETLNSMCPGALKITLCALQWGAQLELAQCLKMEYRVACRSTENHDFPEGVRALLMDKDNNPKWNPSTLEEVTDEYVQSFFKKLPEDEELKFFF